ncbi:MAG: hypothetical protein AB1938_27100 [Myxococcota bacterium]
MGSEHDTLQRLEALLISLRDQVDALAERVDERLTHQHRTLCRLQADLVELAWEVREVGLDVEGPRRAEGPSA